MPIEVNSTHVATLTVPQSGNPAETITVTVSPDGRLMYFVATSDVSEADARGKLRAFLQAARDAAQA